MSYTKKKFPKIRDSEAFRWKERRGSRETSEQPPKERWIFIYMYIYTYTHTCMEIKKKGVS